MTVEAKIRAFLEAHPVVLYMKGTPAFPMCGFSSQAVAILRQCDVAFSPVNILDDHAIREGIKRYGNWPTIPQLYIRGTLVGGSDIMVQLYESGELQEMLSSAPA